MNSLTCQYAPSMHAANRHDRALPCCKQSSFLSGQAVRCSAASSISARPGRRPLQVVSFKFLKSMGLKKPSFLPDFGQAKRQTLLTQLFSTTDRQTLESLIAEGATIQEGGKGSQKYSRTEWIEALADRIAPAVPNFKWGASTDGSKDDAGWSLVTVQACGHHTGTPFKLPGLDPVEPSGKHFKLAEECIKVRVEDNKAQEIIVLSANNESGAVALYKALGGVASASMRISGQTGVAVVLKTCLML